MGEQVKDLELNYRGAIIDRVYALSDCEGKLESGKTTKRFIRVDGLLSLRARLRNEDIPLFLPDGEVLHYRDLTTNRRLSQFLGIEVKLVKEDADSHVDENLLHILTSSELTYLRTKHVQTKEIDKIRFRPNIVIDTTLSNKQLIGKTVMLGEGTIIIKHQAERCRMIGLEQAGLKRCPELLIRIATKLGNCFGT